MTTAKKKKEASKSLQYQLALYSYLHPQTYILTPATMVVRMHFPIFVTINHNHKTVTKMQYFEIAVKLITGMIGILVFLRIAGKAQMGA
ncbi:hypothetical protein HMPREF1991_02064 [Hoylesella loescheii DSM 19665 = JCM 12249 = ATCC 15930]|uniref:Uncharacterized protein n=1 Tax=Hoylesella loescheii DSM 19665 = JCM 12249 = ATCC 15930 TaxID=1122985 RepID=A0A069QG56_HOYLO|nr:hypothetical protein HMPREF1991_02064 [Hoylesella loescheii DSM 19665 = JCM 12249 = ATCC 15930]